jgi:hypothetical protein
MHPHQHICHPQQVTVLVADHVPLLGGQWPVYVHVRQQAEREDDESEVHPGGKQQHHH